MSNIYDYIEQYLFESILKKIYLNNLAKNGTIVAQYDFNSKAHNAPQKLGGLKIIPKEMPNGKNPKIYINTTDTIWLITKSLPRHTTFKCNNIVKKTKSNDNNELTK